MGESDHFDRGAKGPALEQCRTKPDPAAHIAAYQSRDRFLGKDLPNRISRAPWWVAAWLGVMDLANPMLPGAAHGHGISPGTFAPTQKISS